MNISPNLVTELLWRNKLDHVHLVYVKRNLSSFFRTFMNIVMKETTFVHNHYRKPSQRQNILQDVKLLYWKCSWTLWTNLFSISQMKTKIVFGFICFLHFLFKRVFSLNGIVLRLKMKQIHFYASMFCS